MKLTHPASLSILILCLVGCETQQVAGTGSQTGNSVVAGRIAPSDSLPVTSNIKIYLRPLSWTYGQGATMGGLQSTTTDSAGYYSFRDVPADTYRIEAAREHLGWSKTVRALDGTVNLAPVGKLQTHGRLIVKLNFSDTIRAGRVEFYGLNRYQEIPSSSSHEIQLRFDDLPAGLQTVRIYLPALSRMFCEAPVRIGPDSVSVIEYEDLDRSGKGPEEDR